MLNIVSANGGVVIQPEIEESPIIDIEHSNNTSDGDEWNITIIIDNATAENGTFVQVKTQICTNDGVCQPPENRNMTVSGNNSTWKASMFTIEDHTYVNYRITLLYPDETEDVFPHSGWAKSWSSCWRYGDPLVWGGEGCPDDTQSDEGEPFAKEKIPAISLLATLCIICLAGIFQSGKSQIE